MASEGKFAILKRRRRVWAIGAVHGDADRLSALHERLWNRLEDADGVVYLGNLMGRCGAVRATLDRVVEFRCAFLARRGVHVCDLAVLRGAQEEMWHKLLQLQMAPNPREVLPWMLRHGVAATVESYGASIAEGEAAVRDGAVTITRWTGTLRNALNAAPGHAPLLTGLRHAAYTEDGIMLFVNRGLDTSRPLASQGDNFWWADGDFGSIAEPVEGFRRIVRGYDPVRAGVVVGPVIASADGGCGVGGTLVALCFERGGGVVDRIEIGAP